MASRWNDPVTTRLVEGAQKALREAGLEKGAVDLFWVPGAFELPQAVQTAAETKKYDAVIPIGCVIRGETYHFDFICQSVAVGLEAAGRDSGVAVSLGILTVDSLEQALARAGGRYGNKGEDAAWAALELAVLKQELRSHE